MGVWVLEMVNFEKSRGAAWPYDRAELNILTRETLLLGRAPVRSKFVTVIVPIKKLKLNLMIQARVFGVR